MRPCQRPVRRLLTDYFRSTPARCIDRVFLGRSGNPISALPPRECALAPVARRCTVRDHIRGCEQCLAWFAAPKGLRFKLQAKCFISPCTSVQTEAKE